MLVRVRKLRKSYFTYGVSARIGIYMKIGNWFKHLLQGGVTHGTFYYYMNFTFKQDRQSMKT